MKIMETSELRGKWLSINCEARVTAHEAGRVTERERETERWIHGEQCHGMQTTLRCHR